MHVFYYFSGMSGSGKSFTADRLIVKMFADSTKSEWLQDIRKVRPFSQYIYIIDPF